MSRSHRYETTVTWTGNAGTGTSGYRDYQRTHEISADGKPTISGSADPAFRGDPARWNPEELLVVSLSQCHMLSFLSLCAVEGVVVTDYRDRATGTMVETPDGGGHFERLCCGRRSGSRHPSTHSAPPSCTSAPIISASSPARSTSPCAANRPRPDQPSFRPASSLREATPSFGYAL